MPYKIEVWVDDKSFREADNETNDLTTGNVGIADVVDMKMEVLFPHGVLYTDLQHFDQLPEEVDTILKRYAAEELRDVCPNP